jgi:hypothetical protein
VFPLRRNERIISADAEAALRAHTFAAHTAARAAKNAADVAIALRSEKETRLKRRQERRTMQEQQIPAAHPSSLVHFSPLPQQQQQQRVQFAQGEESTFSSAADVHIPLDVRVQVSVVPLGAATSGESSRRSGLAQGGARVIQYSQRTGRRERR